MTLSLLFISCTEDTGMNSNYSLFQQYEVLVSENGNSAYANFRLGTAAGDRVELTNGTNLKINALDTYYQESISATEPEFNYSTTLDYNHKKAIFTFHRRANLDLVNEVEFNSIPYVSFKKPTQDIKKDTSYEIEMGDLLPYEVRIYLLGTGETGISDSAPMGVVSPNGKVTFSNVESGVYRMVIDAVRTYPTTQNDGEAGGSITLIKRKIVNNVRVS